MDDLLMKNNDSSSTKQKKLTKKEERFTNHIDKLLFDQKKLSEDLEKYCYNKRLKKNIYKLDLMNSSHNG